MHYTTSPTTWPHQAKSAPRYTKSALHQAKSTPHQSLTSRTSQHRRDLVEIAMLCRVHTGLPEPDLTQHMSLTVLSTGSSLRPGPTSLVASWNLISIWGELFKNGDRISNVRQDSNEQWAVHATIIMFPYHKYQSKIKNSYLSNSNFTGTSPAWILSERYILIHLHENTSWSTHLNLVFLHPGHATLLVKAVYRISLLVFLAPHSTAELKCKLQSRS